MDRKEFFGEAWKKLLKQGLELIGDHPIVQSLEKMAELKERPPGAVLPDALFQELCTGCDACMIACPVNVIMVEDLERRLPVIYPERDPCVYCAGYPCISACETGALNINTPKTLAANKYPSIAPATHQST